MAHATPPVATQHERHAGGDGDALPAELSAVLSVFEPDPGQQGVADHLAENPGAGEEAECRSERRVEAERE